MSHATTTGESTPTQPNNNYYVVVNLVIELVCSSRGGVDE